MPDDCMGRLARTCCEETFAVLALPNPKKFERISLVALAMPKAVTDRPSSRSGAKSGALPQRYAAPHLTQCALDDSVHVYGGPHNSVAGRVGLGTRLSCEFGDALVD